MAEAPKKRPGRPRKSSVEKQEQFSIRLSFLPKLALEAIARHRNQSLSQAVEYLITRVASEYEIDGRTAMAIVRYRVKDFVQKAQLEGTATGAEEKALETAEILAQVGTIAKLSEAGRLLFMPEELLTEEELFFVNAAYALPLTTIEQMDLELALCRSLFSAGYTAEQALEELKQFRAKKGAEEFPD